MESAHTAEMAVAVAKVTRLLSWSRGILPGVVPTQEALTAYIVAERTVAGSPISLKALVNTVGLSHSGLRKPLQRLLDGGWVAIEADTVDGRVRRVIATDKLLDGLVHLAAWINEPKPATRSL